MESNAFREANSMIEINNVLAAQSRLKGLIRRTPLIGSGYLSERCGAKVFLKLESFQKTGSFKVRGALNKLASLTSEEKQAGVISLSAGNHAQSLAYAASLSGINSTLVMPSNAIEAKIKATEGYGGRVHLTSGDLLNETLAIQEEIGGTLIHPFDDIEIIAGAGTIASEILEDMPDVDMIIVGVGGGGLVSGIGAFAKLTNPAIQIIGVEPEGAAGMSVSVCRGHPIQLTDINTIADGLAAPFAGIHTLAHVKEYVDRMITVSDDSIIQALFTVMERAKILAEPAAAASVAGLLSNQIRIGSGFRVVCVISGGNIGAVDLGRLLAHRS